MPNSHFDLVAAATAEMVREGFHPDFPAGTNEQIAQIQGWVAEPQDPALPDLRGLPWSSIDNDTSRDLDQIEVAERVAGAIRVLIGIADVSQSVAKDSPLDTHAADQTTTIYTAAHNFSMLPHELSTDLTSLNENSDRAAVVIEFAVAADGALGETKIYRALVENKAQLAYSKVSPWLEGTPSAAANPTASSLLAPKILEEQLKLQNEAAKALHQARVRLGALELNRIEADPVVIDGQVRAIRSLERNPATDLIEDFMIAANETMARTLRAARRSTILRVVKSPKRWSRIVDLAAQHGSQLPATPDSAALNAFLQTARAQDPIHYPDLSLAVIKLMGPGEYVLSRGTDDEVEGHFGLAALDYTHSTAPNRRFADLVTQRVVKAMLADQPPPYTDAELESIAQHCTERASAARKVERAMQKRAAAVALAGSIGKIFQGVITNAGEKGVFVRVFDPPVEGMVVRGQQGLDVGDPVTVTLVHTDPQRAFLDFARN